LALSSQLCAQDNAAFNPAEGLSPLKDSYKLAKIDEKISRFALSINPLGFIQFGPVVNAEMRLANNFVLNGHARLSPFGLLSYKTREAGDGLDKFTGMAFGGGFLVFLSESVNKPYIGILAELENTKAVYASGKALERTKNENSKILIVNIGFRRRFNSGVFVNTGVFVGAAQNHWDWKYTHPSYTSPANGEDGVKIQPFGMLELGLGIEI
jgi:hypothetical protein